MLQKAGFDKVANLAGGMVRWRAEGHAALGGWIRVSNAYGRSISTPAASAP
jgi:hypothetical protein